MRALNLILCIALGACGCDNSGNQRGPTTSNGEAQPGTFSASAVEVREPVLRPPGFTEEVFTFKGIPLGKPGTLQLVLQLCEEIELNTAVVEGISMDMCKLKTGGNRPRAAFLVNYGPSTSIKPMSGFYFLKDGTETLEEIDVWGSETYIRELAKALTTRYGEPMAASAEFQNRFGATKDSEVFAWQDPDGNRLVLMTIDPRLTRLSGPGSAVFKSAALVAKERRAEEMRKEAATDNL